MIKFGIGQAVRRVEDQRFLTGQGRYVDDITLPGMCHGVNVLSPHAHAHITEVGASKARAAPGVLLVLTGADIAHDHLGAFTAGMMPEDLGAPKDHRIHQQLLQSDKARFVGDRIAFVVAETLAQARDAADLVEVDYEPLPAVALLEDAAKDDAPKVWARLMPGVSGGIKTEAGRATPSVGVSTDSESIGHGPQRSQLKFVAQLTSRPSNDQQPVIRDQVSPSSKRMVIAHRSSWPSGPFPPTATSVRRV
jgi:xanthine dehydrogenase molybdopterin-binding subunit B